MPTKKRRIDGLYAITPDTADSERLVARVEAALAGGASVVQYRNKSDDSVLRRRQAQTLLRLCRAHAAAFVVNDDVSLAGEIGADGVHLGRDDCGVRDARSQLGSQMLIGVSCYDRLPLALAAQDEGADYVAFGSFFSSAVKPQAVRAPLQLLRQARSRIELPIVAIGGITTDNAAQLIEAGADALAVISALFDVDDTLRAAQSFVRLFASRANPS